MPTLGAASSPARTSAWSAAPLPSTPRMSARQDRHRHRPGPQRRGRGQLHGRQHRHHHGDDHAHGADRPVAPEQGLRRHDARSLPRPSERRGRRRERHPARWHGYLRHQERRHGKPSRSPAWASAPTRATTRSTPPPRLRRRSRHRADGHRHPEQGVRRHDDAVAKRPGSGVIAGEDVTWRWHRYLRHQECRHGQDRHRHRPEPPGADAGNYTVNTTATTTATITAVALTVTVTAAHQGVRRHGDLHAVDHATHGQRPGQRRRGGQPGRWHQPPSRGRRRRHVPGSPYRHRA